MKNVISSIAALGIAAFVSAAPQQKQDEPKGKAADMTKPVKVFILMGQSNMVGMGKVAGGEGSLENAVKTKKQYSYLADAEGNWVVRPDVRYVQMMQMKGLLNNGWLTVGKGKIGVELGTGFLLGEALEEPVMILKSCIGNRGLGWDLLPPGSERFVANGKVYAGYKDKPNSWDVDPAKGAATPPPAEWLDKKGKPIEWYAGKNYDDDTGDAKKVLADLGKYYPGATKYEVAGFFFWQGEKDLGDPVYAENYEKNMVTFIKALRKDFNAPNAKFVLATLGEAAKGCEGNGGKILEAHLAVDGNSGKHPEFKGNVATIYANPLSLGGSGNGHYNGNAETYMNVGEAMGKAMVELLKSK